MQIWHVFKLWRSMARILKQQKIRGHLLTENHCSRSCQLSWTNYAFCASAIGRRLPDRTIFEGLLISHQGGVLHHHFSIDELTGVPWRSDSSLLPLVWMMYYSGTVLSATFLMKLYRDSIQFWYFLLLNNFFPSVFRTDPLQNQWGKTKKLH